MSRLYIVTDIFIGTYEESSSYRDYEREYSTWYTRIYDEQNGGIYDFI